MAKLLRIDRPPQTGNIHFDAWMHRLVALLLESWDKSSGTDPLKSAVFAPRGRPDVRDDSDIIKHQVFS